MPGTYLLIRIIGSAMLLLWGIRMARTSVMRAYGTNIRIVLPQKLGNRLLALTTGIGAATVLQSSTAVAIFVAALASQGVIPVAGGLAVMLGADVGSAVVAVLLSLNLKNFWPVCIGAGYLLHSFGNESRALCRQFGRFFLGLGMVLIALTFMSQASGELAASPTIAVIVRSLSGEPILATLTLATLTWLSHSSMAVLLFLASLAGSGIVRDAELIVACVLGINLGGGIPAIVMTMGQAAAARRIIWGNGLFRLLGVIAGLAAVGPLAALFGMLSGEPGVRVVCMHILFNLALVVAFMPFLGQFAGLLQTLLPDAPVAPAEEFGPRYIVPPAGAYAAALPLSALTRETLRMGDVVMQMLVETGNLLHARQVAPGKVQEIRRMDDKVDVLYRAIRAYAIELTRSDDLPASGMRRITGLFRYAVGLENTGDLIEKSLLDITAQKNKSRRSFSEDGDAELMRLFAFVVESMQLSAEVVMSWNAEAAGELRRREGEFCAMVAASSDRHIERLRRGVSGSMETSSFHLDIINDLQRINSIVSSIAPDVIAATEEEKEERKAEDDDGAGEMDETAKKTG